MTESQLKHQFIRVNGHSIAYLEQGEGTPVLLVHGIPTSSLLWRNVIPRLAAGRRVIAPDLLNYGQSAKLLEANVSIEAQSRLLIGVLDALGARRADVVAHDIGGGIAQILAVNYPERVGKLVLANSVCFDSWPIPEFKPLQEEGAEERMALDEFLKMLREFLPNGVYRREAVSQEIYDMILKPWASEEGKRALFRNFRRLNPEYTQAIAAELKHLPHESLILWGRHDPFQKPHYAERLAKTIPHARLEWVEAAHWIMEEKPAEVAAVLETFLRTRVD